MRWILLGLGVLLAGCVEPVQYRGPIAVDHDGTAGRMRAMCRAGLIASCRDLRHEKPRGGKVSAWTPAPTAPAQPAASATAATSLR